jgi:hypothetical protein
VEWWEQERRKPLSSKNNSTQDSEGTEENGYSISDLNKTMKNVTKEPNVTHIKNLQRKNLERYHWQIHGEDTRHG